MENERQAEFALTGFSLEKSKNDFWNRLFGLPSGVLRLKVGHSEFEDRIPQTELDAVSTTCYVVRV